MRIRQTSQHPSVILRSVEETQRELDDCNAFLNPDVADEEGRRLRMLGRAGV